MNGFIEQYQRVLGSKGKPDGTQWMFPCPFDGCASYDKWKLRVSPETGAWQCKHCNHVVTGKQYREDCREPHGGTWRDFVKEVGDEANISLWPTEKQDNPIKPPDPLTRKKAQKVWEYMFAGATLLDEHRTHLMKRGIDPEKAGYVSSEDTSLSWVESEFGKDTAVRAGLGYLDDSGKLKPTKCVQPGRILIPYYQGQSIVHFVGYMRCPDKTEAQTEEEYKEFRSNWVKVAGPVGFSTQIYGSFTEIPDYIIVTEGQIKAESAIQKGFPCVGLTGMGNNHKDFVKECIKRSVDKVIILFDTQLEDQDNIDYEAERLARELLKKGIQPFRASLPIDPDKEAKVDIDSFFLTHSEEEFTKVLLESANNPYLFDC